MKTTQKLQQRITNSLLKLRTGNSLKARIANGSIWLGAGSGVEQGLRLLRNIILTRILAPEAFGVIAIILAINAIFESFTEIGIKQAVIQNPKGHERTFLNGAWWLSFVRSIILYALACVVAPLISRFYANPELVPLMRVAFLSILFNGMLSVQAYVDIKQMNFKRWAVIYHGGSICGVLMTIALSFYFRNVWALVVGFTVEAVARLILSYIICPFRPGFRFDKESSQALFKYARGMLGLPILTFIFMRADIFLIGKLYPPSDLGLYSMAAILAQVPFQFLLALMSQILMPVYSEIQTDDNRINNSIFEITTAITFLTFPLCFIVFFYGKYILTLVYGAQYSVVAMPFAIIFTSAMIKTCSGPIVTVYFASGHPELHRKFVAIRAILIIVLIYPAVKLFGLVGAASAGLIAMSVGYFFQVTRVRQLTGLTLVPYAMIFLLALGISVPLVLVWIATHSFSLGAPLNIVFGIIGCLLSYSLAIVVYLRMKKAPQLYMAANRT